MEGAEGLPIATPIKGVRIEGHPHYKGSVVEDLVALESPINIYINDEHFVTLFATPYQLKELAIGHLLGEGIIDGISDVEDAVVDGTDVLVSVKRDGLDERLKERERIKFIISSCGSVDDYVRALDKINKPRVTSNYKVTAEKLMQLIRQAGRGSESFRRSISVHAATLYDGERDSLVCQLEDVNRHATVDKAIGRAALDWTDFSRSILFTTGRQASDMVLKAARAGIPITVSLRGPLFSGIYSAQKTGVTMVSVTRGKGATIYSHPERIIF